MHSLALDPRLEAELDDVLRQCGALHPYEVAWELEGWGCALPDPLLRAAFLQVWTPTRIAKCSTEEVDAILGTIGIEGAIEAVMGERGTSAWAVSDQWKKALARPVNAHENMVLGLVACAHWARFRADEPSDEMLYDRLVAGELLASQKQWGAACDCFKVFWDSVAGRLPKNLRRATGATGLFRGVLLEAWAERYCLTLVRAASDWPDYMDTGLAFIDAYLLQFPATGGTAGWMLHATKGRFQLQSGRAQEGFTRFEALIREDPTSPAGFRALADAVLACAEPPLAIVKKTVALLIAATHRRVDASGAWELSKCVQQLNTVAASID